MDRTMDRTNGTCTRCGGPTLWTDGVCTYCKREAGISDMNMMTATIVRTRASIPTRLTLAGVAYQVTTAADGALRYVIDGRVLTPGEAVDRYL